MIAETYNDNVFYPTIAYGENEYMVIFNQLTGSNKGLHAVRVTPLGEVLDETWLTVSSDVNARNPDVAYCGGHYLVVWDIYLGTTIKAARVTPEGDVLDADGFIVKDGSADTGHTAVACNDSAALVVWVDQRNHPTTWGYDLFGRFVDADTGVLAGDDFDISTVDQWQTTPALAFDGTNYIALWRDYRHSPDTQIYGARITPQGQVLDPDGFAFSPYAGKNQTAHITCKEDGHCLGTYSLWMQQPGYNNYRVQARMIDTTVDIPTTTTTTYTTTTTISADDDFDDDVNDDNDDDANDDTASPDDDIIDDDAVNDDFADDDVDDDIQNGGSSDDDDSDQGGCFG